MLLCWQSYGFSSSNVLVWELDDYESWAQKNLCFWDVVLEKTLESPLDCKEIIGRTDAKAPILWPANAKNWFIWKGPVAGKDRKQEEKEMMEEEMVGWHHWFNGHVFEQALGDSEEQGSLVCCSPYSRKESDMTEWLNKTTANKWLYKGFKITWFHFSLPILWVTEVVHFPFEYILGLISYLVNYLLKSCLYHVVHLNLTLCCMSIYISNKLGEKKSVLSRGERGEMNVQNLEGFENSENTLCINTTLNIYHYTFVQNCRM